MSDPAWDINRQPRGSPFKAPPLRLPGQSVDERISILHARIDDLLVIPLCFVVVAGYGWIQWWTGRPLHPLILTAVAIIAVACAWIKLRPIRRAVKKLKLGRDGERIVGQMLEQLRGNGYRVFHDIPGPSFNIDHVIVGPAGIFSIETKARTKPIRGRGKIIYDGDTVQIEGKGAVDAPLNQVRAQAHWLAALLNDGHVSKHRVRPVLVFPEWYIEWTGPRLGRNDVWVLNPKALARFLEHEPHILSPAIVEMVAHILSLYCRQSMRESA